MGFVAKTCVSVFAHLKSVAELVAFDVGQNLFNSALAHFYSCVTFAQEIYCVGVHTVCPFVFVLVCAFAIKNIRVEIQGIMSDVIAFAFVDTVLNEPFF